MAAAKLKNKKKAGDGSALAAVLEKKGEVIAYEVMEHEKLPGSRIRFRLKMTEEAIKGRLEATYKEFNRFVNVPGFRPGMAPRALIQKRYDPAVRSEMVKRMVGRLTELFTEANKIEPLSQPYLLDFKSSAEAGTIVELALEVRPEVPLTEASLDGLTAEIHEVIVDDSLVTRELERLQKENATFEPTEEGYRPGDGMLFDCLVTDVHGGVVQDRSVSQYYSTNIEGEMPEAVAAALVGKAKGETVEMDVSEDADTGVAGLMETVHYKVSILEVKARNVPALDDDFAKDVSEEYATLEDLKKATMDRAREAETAREREEILERIYDVLRDRVEFDLPRAMVDQNAQQAMYQMEKRLNQFGVSLRSMDKTIVQNYASSVRSQARLNVKNGLMLTTLANQLNITVSEQEIAAELERIAKASGRKPLAVRAQLEARKQWDAFQDELRLKLANDALIARTAVTRKSVTWQEFEAMARQRQEEQAARLRGEEVRARAQDEAEAKSLNLTVEEMEKSLATDALPVEPQQ